MNASEIKTALKERYCAPEHSIFFEVADGTGLNASRRCDAVVMSLWPSRGLELHGMEIKATRSDWLRELKKPEKAENVFRYMDRWWLVVGDASIVKQGELPPTWGLITPQSGAMRQAVEAPRLKPEPISRSFLAALLRRAGEMAVEPEKAALERERSRGFDEGCKCGKLEAERNAKRFVEVVEAFEREIGGHKLDRYSDWANHKLARAVKTALVMGDVNVPLSLDVLETQAKKILEGVEAMRAVKAEAL